MKLSAIIVVITLLAVTGCNKTPIQMSRTQNPDINVDLLFEHDGCKVYRFGDGGRSRYFSKCSNKSSVSWTETCGKNCRTEQQVDSHYVGE